MRISFPCIFINIYVVFLIMLILLIWIFFLMTTEVKYPLSNILGLKKILF